MSQDMKDPKKTVTNEWLIAIPELIAFSQNKLYKIVGCSIIGVELIKLPKIEAYRPYFVLYPLWEDTSKKCLNSPAILLEIINKKEFQFSIPFVENSLYFAEVIECVKVQVPILFTEIVTLKSLFQLVDILFSDILVKSNSAQQAKLLELKFYLALYADNQLQIQSVIDEIQERSKNWNLQMFEMWYGNFDLWQEGLEQKAANRKGFIKRIEVNKLDRKISQLRSSEPTI